jgi:hypothetical protein
MTSTPDAGEVPTHRRRIELDAYDRGEDLLVVARLRDDRPWAAGTDQPEHVHDMTLEVTVHRPELVVTAVQAEMRHFPHAECRQIEGAFQGLVGLQVGRGYTRAVQERFGRALGCTHLELLARLLGPVVVQSIPSSVLRAHPEDGGRAALAETGSSWFADSCHVWASEGPGPGMQKLALGWRPGTTAYPAPPVAELRRAAGGAADGAAGGAAGRAGEG